MKELLRKMFQGWMLQEASWDGEQYTRPLEECMIQAADGNVIEGNLLALFEHWGNDIQSLAPHYGLFLDRDADGKLFINEDIPAPPEPVTDFWWEPESRKWIPVPQEQDWDVKSEGPKA